MFVDVCAEMFPDIAQGLKDERVNIYYEDGLRSCGIKGQI